MAPKVDIDGHLVEHWTVLRSNLHDPSSWSNKADISLTYVPTLSGFSGPPQRDMFCSLHAASKHPFHPSTSSRFNNRLQRISINVDKDRGVIIEELSMSMLHNERMDWLLPGHEESRKVLNIHFVVIGQLEQEAPWLLQSVRVYWDQALVWKESGLLSRALFNSARVGLKGYDEQSALEILPLPDGAKTMTRLLNPTPYNCNQLSPLDAISGGIGMLALKDNVREITTEPPIRKEIHPAFKEHSVIMGEEELMRERILNEPVHKRDNPVFKTTMEFKDEFEPVKNDSAPKTFKNIFTDPLEPAVPNISLDPKRNQSSIFSHTFKNESAGTAVGSINPNRLASTIFADGPMEAHKQQLGSSRPRGESHIFDTSNSPQTRIVQQPRQLISHIEQGESMEEIESPKTSEIDPNRFTSHIDFSEINVSAPVSYERKVATKHAFNSILLGGGLIDENLTRKQQYAGASSIKFDFDNPQNSVAQPSTRY